MCALSVVFIALGAALQAGGFGLVLYQSVTTRRRQVPDTPSVYSLLGRRLTAEAAQIREKSLSIARAALAKVGIRWTRTLDMEATLRTGGKLTPRPVTARAGKIEERIELLEAALPELEQRVTERIEDAVQVVESRRTDELRKSIQLEEAGILAFVLGLAFTTAGALV